MFSIQNYNGGKIFDINTDLYEFDKLANIFDKKAKTKKIFVLNGFWFNTSRYGKQVILIVSQLKKLLNLPNFLTATFEKLATDNEAIEAIKQGKVGFTIYEYEKNGKKYYSIKFVDIE